MEVGTCKAYRTASRRGGPRIRGLPQCSRSDGSVTGLGFPAPDSQFVAYSHFNLEFQWSDFRSSRMYGIPVDSPQQTPRTSFQVVPRREAQVRRGTLSSDSSQLSAHASSGCLCSSRPSARAVRRLNCWFQCDCCAYAVGPVSYLLGRSGLFVPRRRSASEPPPGGNLR